MEVNNMYYIEIKNNKIIGKCICNNVETPDNFIEVTESRYNSIELPSTFELDENKNIINITHIPHYVKNQEINELKNKIVLLTRKVEQLEERLNTKSV